MVIESASDSKLQIEVGVSAGFRYGDAAGLSFVESGFCVFPPAASDDDFAGVVRVRLRSFLLRFITDPDNGDGALFGFVAGKSDSRGEEDTDVGDVARRWRR
jgi:hypothetical protein